MAGPVPRVQAQSQSWVPYLNMETRGSAEALGSRACLDETPFHDRLFLSGSGICPSSDPPGGRKTKARSLSRFRTTCRCGCHVTKGDLPKILRNMVEVPRQVARHRREPLHRTAHRVHDQEAAEVGAQRAGPSRYRVTAAGSTAPGAGANTIAHRPRTGTR